MSRQLDDWLERYLELTRNTESPTLYHTWAGLCAISTCLERKCYSEWGLQGNIYPNMYVALVGPPGGRKGTAMKIAKNMLTSLDSIHLGSDSLGSTQMLFKQIQDANKNCIDEKGKEEAHRSLSIWSEEFQVFIKDRDDNLIAAITDLFDCPNKWDYSSLKQGKVPLNNCYLTIIGAITPSLLQSTLNATAVGGGLASRILFIVGYGQAKSIPLTYLSKEEKELLDMLASDLYQINQMSGPFYIDKCYLNAYTKWYTEAAKATGIDDDKFVGYNARRPLHIRKISMLMCAAESTNMILQERHFHKALYLIEEAEAEMPNAFYGVGRGVHADIQAKLLSFADARREFTYTEVLRKFQLDALPGALNEMLNSMEQCGILKADTSQTEAKFTVIKTMTKSTRHPLLKETVYKHIV